VFKHLASVVNCSSGILGLYLTGLTMLSPIAYAGEYNELGAFSSAKDESAIEGGKASDNKGDDSYRPNRHRLANIRAAQLQAQLEADRKAYIEASNRVKQLQSEKPQPNPTSSIPSKHNNSNPDVPTNATSSSLELSTSTAAETQAAINLSETEHRIGLFLRSVKSSRSVLPTRIILY
jgi:hypothetical protein